MPMMYWHGYEQTPNPTLQGMRRLQCAPEL
ncbi:hypothetical protein BN874_140030 [Candidatus Contendobacter odensis Run_B_J11]|uniref:Uncharacterized protein n=1 Tax=Candidatus Contendobacter odensis Run_B_J11 TaxID=1400861 RepID=A0A7U7G908_9GAMM|nr:hypothetical protein BN874_140030 [Candidatus Contendobacter odensis Run_B_J11]